MHKYKEKYTKFTEHKRVHYMRNVLKSSGRLKVERYLYNPVIPLFHTHVHLSLNFPAKANILVLLPRFPLPRFPPLLRGAIHSRVFIAPQYL